MFSSVLLPQPDGPMMDTISPLRMLKFRPCTATVGSALPLTGKRLVTPLNSISTRACFAMVEPCGCSEV
ncbi:hypothetical protein D9M68_917330 [compost metagenome]